VNRSSKGDIPLTYKSIVGFSTSLREGNGRFARKPVDCVWGAPPFTVQLIMGQFVGASWGGATSKDTWRVPLKATFHTEAPVTDVLI